MEYNVETSFIRFFFSPKGKMERDDYITGNLLLLGIFVILFLLRKYLPPVNPIFIIVFSITLCYVFIAMGLKRLRDANLPIWLISFFFLTAIFPIMVLFLCLYEKRKNKKGS